MKKTRLVQYCQYLLVRIVETVFLSLPLRASLRLAVGIGWLAFVLDRRHRKVALDNLSAVYGKRYGEKRIRRMAATVFGHFGMAIAEAMRLRRIMRLPTALLT